MGGAQGGIRVIAGAILFMTAAIEFGIVFQHILRCNLAAWDDWLEVSNKGALNERVFTDER